MTVLDLMQERLILKRMVSTLQKFSFETQNGEHYLAQNPNIYYQNKRPSFKGITYSEQKQLPSLPIPQLEKTLHKYLQTIKPFCASDEQFEKQKLLCSEFSRNGGPELQNRLIEYANGKRNWLSKLWDNQAYLEYDDPVVPYVSYFYSHKPLPISHKIVENDPLVKATAIISIVARFLEAVKDESLPAEHVKNAPFCMNSFHMMFNNCRIPGPEKDTNVFYSIYEHDYIIVALKGNFYKLYTHSASGEILPPAKIWEQLYTIINSLRGSIQEKSNAGIGTLTSLSRKQWAEACSALMANAVSRESLETIHKSAFVLCLDLDEKPVTLEEKSRYAWHGDGFNRFYDKPLQFFVAGNGHSGFLAEHSKMDGTPTLFLNNHVCKKLHELDPEKFVAEIRNPSSNLDQTPEHLSFVVTPSISTAIKNAQENFKKVVGQHELRVWHYVRYGKTAIKNFGFSPDAFIQQIIQLAVFKYLGKQLPTYEAASTRKYFKGRTETGRSVSIESAKFVREWENPDIALSQKVENLQASIKAHSAYLKSAADGHGVDRHFFGLKNMLRKGETSPALFQDKLFQYSSTWLISTSQLSSEYFEGYGWSQVNDNGFGLAYMLNKDWLHINIVNKPEFSMLSVDKMHYYLTQAAEEIYDALNEEHQLKAKL